MRETLMGYRVVHTVGPYKVHLDERRPVDDAERVSVTGPGLAGFPLGTVENAAKVAQALQFAHKAGFREGRRGCLKVDEDGIIWPD